ncbi:MAG TPA: ROK family protein [Syntrophobacteria bacterium]|nr:ROK family protein [Syntrophobacteria bacterium]
MNQGAVAVAGVDIGGTNIKVALVDPTSGRLVERQSFKTMAERGPEAVVQDLSACVRDLSRQAGARGFRIAGIGVGCAGIIDSRKGLVLTSPNLPGWVRFPLGPLLATQLQLPVAVGNDVDCIGCGEHWLGAGRDLGDFLGVALGTGVGGCLIIGGRAWTGAGGSAGEVGHMTIEPGGERCLCGNRGCLETLASASWVVRRAKERLRRGSPSRLDATGGALDAETIYRAAMDGDQLAGELFAQVGKSLAIAIANVIHLVGIRGVVIGGGLAQAWAAFIGPLREELTQRLTMAPVAEVRIVRAQLGDDAGSLGAAYLASSELELL